jgi:predicted kinase
MKLILIRGLPGSGKSTLAQKQAAIHFEADMFFMQNGLYSYDTKLIKEAHNWCENQTATTLQHGHSVVVSNTFIKWWQIKPYIYLAKQYNVVVELIETIGNYQNVHAVPEAIIAHMKTNYERNALIINNIIKIIPASQLCLSQAPFIV